MATAPSPPPFDPADDKTTRFLVSCSVVVVIATLAVFCRLLARAVTKVGFAPDDWFIILALLDAWAIFVMNVFRTCPVVCRPDRQNTAHH